MKLAGDRVFAFLTAVLLIGGVAVFFSASLGLLARDSGSVSHIALTQLVLGVAAGLVALVLCRFLPQQWLPRLAPPLYILGILSTLLVFIPSLGLTANGATRWIDLGFATVQPAEFLKIGTILMLAWLLSRSRRTIKDWRKGLLPFLGILGLPALVLIAQPNTSTAIVLGATALTLYLLAGAPFRDLVIIMGICIVVVGALIFTRPYLMERVLTLIDPSRDPLASGYQIQQSLIAIGSGEALGKGFGQGVQKFNYLPEPVGDSVFAVVGEELGFAGAATLILIFVMFAARGLAIAAEASTTFETFAAAGLTLMIILSAFLNIGAMLGVLPLTGLPLPFVSHGGTALFTALASVGIILNVAAHRKNS